MVIGGLIDVFKMTEGCIESLVSVHSPVITLESLKVNQTPSGAITVFK